MTLTAPTPSAETPATTVTCGCGCPFVITPGMQVHLINGIAYTQGCVSPLVLVEAPPGFE